jgi:iron complex transport system ATP-binding protein
MTPLLETHGLTVARGARALCRSLDLRIEAGQRWSLLGRNGAGKTSLLHALGGLVAADSGQVLLQGTALHGLRPRTRARALGVLFQHSSPGFGASVLETVLAGRHPHLGALEWEGAGDLAIARHWIDRLGLGALAGRPCDRLSGGELRRVEIARLLTQQPRVSLLDEPLNHLDLAQQGTVLDLLGEACSGPGHAYLMTMHDLNQAYRSCDHWLLLDGSGGWLAGPRDAIARPELLSQAFGCQIGRIDTGAGPLFLAAD